MFLAVLVGPQTGYPFERASPSVKETSKVPVAGCQFRAESRRRQCPPESCLLSGAVRISPGTFLSGPDWA